MSLDNTRYCVENTFTDINLDMDAPLASSTDRKREVHASRICNTVIV